MIKNSGTNGKKSISFLFLLVFLAIITIFPVSGSTETYSYSFIHISDTQHLSASYPSTLNFTFSYLDSIKNDYNITAVIHTGDLVNAGDSGTQWDNYAAARSRTTIPLFEVSGNHDIIGGYPGFDEHIGINKRNWNATFDDILFIGIGYTRTALSSSQINGYISLINENSSKIPVFATHEYFNGVTYPAPLSPLGSSIQSNLCLKDPTIIMCGHLHGNLLHSGTWNQVTLIEDMTNYQGYGNYSAGKLYTVYKINSSVSWITVRDIYIFPSQSIGPEIFVYQDLTPPSIITGLNNLTYLPDSIQWGWTDPADPDFDHVVVYLDGTWNTNITKGSGTFNATGLAPGTSCTIATRTADINGNLNMTWVNQTASTSPAGSEPAGSSHRIGVYNNGSWLLDFDGSGNWTAGDKNYAFGSPGWTPVLGDWNNDGVAGIGIFKDGIWLLDFDGSGNWTTGDKNYRFGTTSWTPVAGDWNRDGSDEIGVYKNGSWLLDYDGSGRWSTGDKNYPFGASDWSPLTGDWNGDGYPEIGIYKNGTWLLDYDGSGGWSAGDKNYPYGAAGWIPIVGDWNGDNYTEIGVYRDGAWLLDYDGSGRWSHDDLNLGFGAAGWTPVIGDWDGNNKDQIGIYKDGAWLLDYDGSGGWTTSDKSYSFGSLGWTPTAGKFF